MKNLIGKTVTVNGNVFSSGAYTGKKITGMIVGIGYFDEEKNSWCYINKKGQLKEDKSNYWDPDWIKQMKEDKGIVQISCERGYGPYLANVPYYKVFLIKNQGKE